MPQQDIPPFDEFRAMVQEALALHWKSHLAQGIILVILGALAIAIPVYSTLAVGIFIGWLFVIGGIVRFAALVRFKHMPGYWWSLFASILVIIIGLLLIVRPMPGILTLTLLMAFIFAIEGFASIFAALDFRHHSSNWVWILVSGLASLALVVLIMLGWPESASWAIGLFAGINLLFTGLSLIMLAAAVPHRDRTNS
jgi:uncharacterized membrane protein HdeD (DUF308 family)